MEYVKQRLIVRREEADVLDKAREAAAIIAAQTPSQPPSAPSQGNKREGRRLSLLTRHTSSCLSLRLLTLPLSFNLTFPLQAINQNKAMQQLQVQQAQVWIMVLLLLRQQGPVSKKHRKIQRSPRCKPCILRWNRSLLRRWD